MNCVTKSILFSAFSLTNTINWKNEQKEIGSSTCLVLVASILSPSNLSRMSSILLIIFTALPHVSMCAMWASCDVRCHYPEHFFLGLSCFCSGGAGRSALASVPELHVSSFRKAAWLNFAGFRSSGDFFAYRILLSTIVCDNAVLLVLVVAVS